MRSFALRLALLAALVAGAVSAAPEWVTAVVSRPVEPIPSGAPARHLLIDSEISWDDRGRLTTRFRVVTQIATNEGRSFAAAGTSFLESSDRFNGGAFGLLRSQRDLNLKQGIRWDTRPWEESGVARTEVRVAAINLSDIAEPSDIFYAEWTRIENPLLAETSVELDRTLPIVRQVVEFRAPPGWSLESRQTGVSAPERSSSPQPRLRWDWQPETWVGTEPNQPQGAAWRGRIVVTPTPAKGTGQRLLTFNTWEHLGAWLRQLWATQAGPASVLEQKAREIAAPHPPSSWQALKELSRYVQTIPYVAISERLGKGQGYQPRATDRVLSQYWGDCKDKTNLLVELARPLGWKAIPALTYIGDDGQFDETWPTPTQFNHAIVAIPVPATETGPAIIETPTRGRVLLFDPTDSVTPLGALSPSLWGQPILLVDDVGAEWVRLPSGTVPERQRWGHELLVTVHVDGKVTGRLREEGLGRGAAYQRALEKNLSEKEKTDHFTAQIRRAFRTAEVSSVDFEAGPSLDRYAAVVNWVASEAGQVFGDGRVALRVDVFGVGFVPAAPAPNRRAPWRQGFVHAEDRVTLKVEAPWIVEEVPRDVALETPFGSLQMTWTRHGSELQTHRILSLPLADVAPKDFAAYRSFVSRVARSLSASVVLRRPTAVPP